MKRPGEKDKLNFSERLLMSRLEKNEPSDLDAMCHFIVDAMIENLKDDRNGTELLGLALNMTYLEKVSNTHSSPAGFFENWGGKAQLPTGYPGLSGRCWILLSRSPSGFSSSITQGSGLHTGTGGYGSYDGPFSYPSVSQTFYPLSYGAKVFEYDFEKSFLEISKRISENKEKIGIEKVMARLEGRHYAEPCVAIKHKFLWTSDKIEDSMLSTSKNFKASIV